jgi:hypothetical protein
MYAAYAWENGAGKGIMKEFWDVILENVSDILDTYNEDDDNNRRNYGITMMVDEKGRKFIGLKHGCKTSRWWTFGEAATILYNMLSMRITLHVAQTFDKMAKNGKACGTCQTLATWHWGNPTTVFILQGT